MQAQKVTLQQANGQLRIAFAQEQRDEKQERKDNRVANEWKHVFRVTKRYGKLSCV